MNKIGWCDRTLNAVVGCPHGCIWCYAKRQAKRQKQRCSLCYDFVVHPHLERLKQLSPNQKPQRIFMDSMWDWNAIGVKDEWIEAILEKIKECPQHTFQILSQRPIRYSRFEYPKNVWLGTTVRDNKDVERIRDLMILRATNIKFISFEPLHEEIDTWLIGKGVSQFYHCDWVIIGAETGNRIGKIIPQKRWIDRIIFNADMEHISVYLKDNLSYPMKMKFFPLELR